MTSKWTEKCLGDVIALQRGHDLPTQSRGHGTIPIIGSAGLTGYHEKFIAHGPGVVVGRSGNAMGEVHFVTELYWPLNTTLYVTDFKGNDERFIYYFLKTIDFNQFNSGSAQKSLNRNAVYPYKVKITENKEEQKQIAKILGDIEDKISLNYQINQTLEQMAQAIFKSWFVDFDPVRAKMKYRQPEGMDAETAALFPDEFVESELGPIPKDWSLSNIGNEVDVLGGGTPSTKNEEFWIDGEFNWTTPKDLSGLPDKILLNTERKLTQKGISNISSGLLPANTVLMSSRAPVGYLVLTKIPTAINQGFIAMKCNKRLSPEFVLQWATHSMDEIKQRSSGSTFAEISKATFRPLPVVVPSENIMAAYTKVAEIMYEKIAALAQESESLASARDMLLPKLLSGAVKVEG
jgi:type I restriction enzyme, S subunit